MGHPTNFGHRIVEGSQSFIVYTVYNNRTDLPIIIDGTATDCAKAMGIALDSFYSTVCLVKAGKLKKWSICSRFLDGQKGYNMRNEQVLKIAQIIEKGRQHYYGVIAKSYQSTAIACDLYDAGYCKQGVGRWMETADIHYVMCSECRAELDDRKTGAVDCYQYCPFCGAKMESEE